MVKPKTTNDEMQTCSAAARTEFSFIIPAKQEGKYIGRSLRYLVMQKEKEDLSIEIIVVDGRSTDATVREASNFADKIIDDCALASVSIAHARNAGARAASGSFVFHTDADVFVPNLAKLLAHVSRQFSNPAVVAVTMPVMPYPWESTWRDHLIHRLANTHFRISFRYGAFFARGECQIVRRESFEAVGGYRGNLISGEDCDLFRRLSRTGEIAYLPDYCVYHSMRRFRRLGYMRVLGVYLREWIWMVLFDCSFIREWPVIR